MHAFSGKLAGLSGARPPRRCERGFTIIELMVAVAVAAVLLLIAIPNFRSITLTNRLTTTANDMVAAISTARMEAIKQNANSQLCSNVATSNSNDTLGTPCGTETGAVYVLTGTTATKVRAGITGIDTSILVSGTVTALRFGGQGLAHTPTSSLPYDGQVMDICTASMTADNHRVIKMTGGSILTTTTSSGSCTP
jgi:type IV fimbrial biogenesis protein FimT